MNSSQHLVCGQLRDKGVAFVGNIKSDIHWTRTSRETFTSETLQEFVSADLVVIGGGYTGLSTALEAADRGAKVVVVEARNIGYGGSGRNVGLVNAGLWLPPAGIRRVLGDAIGDRLSGILSGAPAAVFELIGKHVDIQAFKETLEVDVGPNLANAMNEARKRIEQSYTPPIEGEVVEIVDGEEAA